MGGRRKRLGVGWAPWNGGGGGTTPPSNASLVAPPTSLGGDWGGMAGCRGLPPLLLRGAGRTSHHNPTMQGGGGLRRPAPRGCDGAAAPDTRRTQLPPEDRRLPNGQFAHEVLQLQLEVPDSGSSPWRPSAVRGLRGHWTTQNGGGLGAPLPPGMY